MDETDRREVRLALRLADDELPAEKLDPVARLEDADLDEAVGSRPAMSLDALAHASTLLRHAHAVNVDNGIQSRP